MSMSHRYTLTAVRMEMYLTAPAYTDMSHRKAVFGSTAVVHYCHNLYAVILITYYYGTCIKSATIN